MTRSRHVVAAALVSSVLLAFGAFFLDCESADAVDETQHLEIVSPAAGAVLSVQAGAAIQVDGNAVELDGCWLTDGRNRVDIVDGTFSGLFNAPTTPGRSTLWIELVCDGTARGRFARELSVSAPGEQSRRTTVVRVVVQDPESLSIAPVEAAANRALDGWFDVNVRGRTIVDSAVHPEEWVGWIEDRVRPNREPGTGVAERLPAEIQLLEGTWLPESMVRLENTTATTATNRVEVNTEVSLVLAVNVGSLGATTAMSFTLDRMPLRVAFDVSEWDDRPTVEVEFAEGFCSAATVSGAWQNVCRYTAGPVAAALEGPISDRLSRTLHDAVEHLEPDQFVQSLLTGWGVESPVAFDVADALAGSDPAIDAWEVSEERVVVEIGVETTWLRAPVPPFLSTAPVEGDLSLVVSTGLLNRLLAALFDRNLGDVIDAVDQGAAQTYRQQIGELQDYLSMTIVEAHPELRLTPSFRWSETGMLLHVGDLKLLRSREDPSVEIVISADVPASARFQDGNILLDLDVADAARRMAAELVAGDRLDPRQRNTLTGLALRLTRDFDGAVSGDAVSLANAGPLVEALESIPPIPASIETEGVVWELTELSLHPDMQAFSFGASVRAR